MDFSQFRKLELSYEAAEEQASKEKIRSVLDKGRVGAEKDKNVQLEKNVWQLQTGKSKRGCQHSHPYSTAKQTDHDYRAEGQACNSSGLTAHFACSKLRKTPVSKLAVNSVPVKLTVDS